MGWHKWKFKYMLLSVRFLYVENSEWKSLWFNRISRKGSLSFSSNSTVNFYQNYLNVNGKDLRTLKRCFQIQTTSFMNLPQKQRESLTLCIVKVSIESMKRFANKRERERDAFGNTAIRGIFPWLNCTSTFHKSQSEFWSYFASIYVESV